jgi:uncharacterized membrane protein
MLVVRLDVLGLGIDSSVLLVLLLVFLLEVDLGRHAVKDKATIISFKISNVCTQKRVDRELQSLTHSLIHSFTHSLIHTR